MTLSLIGYVRSGPPPWISGTRRVQLSSPWKRRSLICRWSIGKHKAYISQMSGSLLFDLLGEYVCDLESILLDDELLQLGVLLQSPTGLQGVKFRGSAL